MVDPLQQEHPAQPQIKECAGLVLDFTLEDRIGGRQLPRLLQIAIVGVCVFQAPDAGLTVWTESTDLPLTEATQRVTHIPGPYFYPSEGMYPR